MIDVLSAILAVLGAGFFIAGTVGLLRFPDLRSRLHAITKADNLGLGLVLAAVALQSGSPAIAAKLAITWVLALVASATISHLLAQPEPEGAQL